MCIKLIAPYSCNGCEFNCTLDAKETKKGEFTPYINSQPVQDAKNILPTHLSVQSITQKN